MEETGMAREELGLVPKESPRLDGKETRDLMGEVMQQTTS